MSSSPPAKQPRVMLENDTTTTIFVPGRICLLGEHSDWHSMEFGQDRNSSQPLALVCGTSQGIHATVRFPDNHGHVVLRSVSCPSKSSCVDMPASLFLTASLQELIHHQDPFFALQLSTIREVIQDLTEPMQQEFKRKGIEIDNFKTDLPVQRGLSSSAAVCVLTVQAIKHAFGVEVDEMEYAYRGERATGSMCGRMDQLVAILTNPGSIVAVTNFLHPLQYQRLQFNPTAPRIFVVCVSFVSPVPKDTRRILRDLRQACASGDKALNTLFSSTTCALVKRAVVTLEDGNVEGFGKIVAEALKEFDIAAAPHSIDNLKAPMLHSLMKNPHVVHLTYGVKSIGAGGDGTALLVAKGEQEADELITWLSQSGAHNLLGDGAVIMKVGLGGG